MSIIKNQGNKKSIVIKIKEMEKNKPLDIVTIAIIPKYVLLGSKYYYSEMGILEIKTHASTHVWLFKKKKLK